MLFAFTGALGAENQETRSCLRDSTECSHSSQRVAVNVPKIHSLLFLVTLLQCWNISTETFPFKIRFCKTPEFWLPCGRIPQDVKNLATPLDIRGVVNIEHGSIFVAVILTAWLISQHFHTVLIHFICPDLLMSSPERSADKPLLLNLGLSLSFPLVVYHCRV